MAQDNKLNIIYCASTGPYSNLFIVVPDFFLAHSSLLSFAWQHGSTCAPHLWKPEQRVAGSWLLWAVRSAKTWCSSAVGVPHHQHTCHLLLSHLSHHQGWELRRLRLWLAEAAPWPRVIPVSATREGPC